MAEMAGQALVLDSWAVIAFMEDEPPAERIEELLTAALEKGVKLLITTVNLGEVWYSIARAHSTEVADNAIEKVMSLGMEVVPADWELTYQAAQFKARVPIAYGDCFAAALAFLKGIELVTGDREFELFGDDLQIIWV